MTVNCQQAHEWLLGARVADEPPPALGEHLRGCSHCQARRRRLQRLDEHARQLHAPPPAPLARAELLSRLDHHPQDVPVLPIPRHWPLRWAGVAAATFLLGLGLGWGLWHGRASLSPLPGPQAEQKGPEKAPPTAPVAKRGEVDLERVLAHVLGHDLDLARGGPAPERLQLLQGMAADLRDAAIHLARHNALQELPLVARLYAHVIQRGLAKLARALPKEQRERLLIELAQQLEDDATALSAAAEQALPVVAGHLRPMARTARALAPGLRAGQLPALALAEDWPLESMGSRGTPGSLLAVLVRQGLELAEAKGPVERADRCSELTHWIAQDIVFASAAGENERATRLGRYLGEILDRGVTSNLDLARRAPLPPARKAEVERIRQHAAAATTTLEENLARAPTPAQSGLQLAIQASRSWESDRDKKKGKRKGKGRGRDRD